MSASKHFIAHRDETFTCEDCWTEAERESTADADVQVWEERSHGWIGPCVCARCKLSIPVYVDGEAAPATLRNDR